MPIYHPALAASYALTLLPGTLSIDQEDRHFMDQKATGKKVAEEVTRESLISISYSLPEKVLTPKASSDKVNGESLVGKIDDDGEEKFRSELISISNTQSPDVGDLPVGGELKD